MVAMHKMSLDFYEDSFALIALHCSLEDFTLAYTLNQYVKCSFKRRNNNLVLSETASFPIFEWKDSVNDKYWTLVKNSVQFEENSNDNGFFENVPTYTKKHLIPEHKNVDYFIKIEHEDLDLDSSILKSIVAIPKMITAYIINNNTLKSKNNLIY